MEYRAGRRGRPVNWDGMITNVDIKEVNGDQNFEIHGVKITTTRVKHTIHTQAYRFDADGKSIVISGDLSYSDNLITLAKNADVLVMDAGQVMWKQQRRPLGPRRKKRSGAQGTRAHSNLEEVATMASKANVKKLVLTHLPPGIIDKEATLEAYRKIYDGNVVIGEDLMEIVP
jgi:ribonuclease BN (tRNA processing enzyme)